MEENHEPSGSKEQQLRDQSVPPETSKDISDDASVEEILAGIPQPSDKCFNDPPLKRYIPRSTKYTDVIFQLEWVQGYTRPQSLWLLGADHSSERPLDSNNIHMRIKRYMQREGLQDAVKAPKWTKRLAAEKGKARNRVNGPLEEIAKCYGGPSIIPAPGEWENDEVPMWARVIWRLMARTWKFQKVDRREVRGLSTL